MNDFTCAACKKDYHGTTPIEQGLREHEERKKTMEDYDDGEEIVQVCDPCFQEMMINYRKYHGIE